MQASDFKKNIKTYMFIFNKTKLRFSFLNHSSNGFFFKQYNFNETNVTLIT